MQYYLSIIIPAYNEEQRLPPTLQSIGEYLAKQSWSSEVLVVSDGSHDKTAEVIKPFGATFPTWRMIANQENHGKGYVVKQGMLAATGELRLFMDADNSTPITELDKLLPHIRTHGAADVVISSMWIKGAKVVKSEFFIRTLAGRLGNLLIRLLLLPGIKDTQRGFKLFTAKAAQDIFSRLQIGRWGFDIEALVLARKMGYSIQEVPIYWTYSKGSKVKLSAYFQVLKDVFLIWWQLHKPFIK